MALVQQRSKQIDIKPHIEFIDAIGTMLRRVAKRYDPTGKPIPKGHAQHPDQPVSLQIGTALAAVDAIKNNESACKEAAAKYHNAMKFTYRTFCSVSAVDRLTQDPSWIKKISDALPLDLNIKYIWANMDPKKKPNEAERSRKNRNTFVRELMMPTNLHAAVSYCMPAPMIKVMSQQLSQAGLDFSDTNTIPRIAIKAINAMTPDEQAWFNKNKMDLIDAIDVETESTGEDGESETKGTFAMLVEYMAKTEFAPDVTEAAQELDAKMQD